MRVSRVTICFVLVIMFSSASVDWFWFMDLVGVNAKCGPANKGYKLLIRKVDRKVVCCLNFRLAVLW